MACPQTRQAFLGLVSLDGLRLALHKKRSYTVSDLIKQTRFEAHAVSKPLGHSTVLNSYLIEVLR